MEQSPAEEPEPEPQTMIKVAVSVRDRIGKIAQRMHVFGGRCSLRNGKELPPVYSVVIDAALTVAGRHASEFAAEVMRRTDARAEAGHLAAKRAITTRPR